MHYRIWLYLFLIFNGLVATIIIPSELINTALKESFLVSRYPLTTVQEIANRPNFLVK